MSLKLLAAVAAVAEGESINVSAACRSAGVSRKAFYKWLARYIEEGLDGLQERSRRPLRSPGQTAPDIEDEIVRLRKQLSDAGLDHGATTIQWHLSQQKRKAVPSVATVHRVLVRRGLVVPHPRKRPKSSYRRFEAAAPNERWQIDAMDWTIETGVVRVFNVIDDHSRVAVTSRAVNEATGVEAWNTFSEGVSQWGLPVGVLSDNGLCFSGKLRGFEVLFEANLRDLGVLPSTGRAYHPQTTGKVERFQQTLKKWLRGRPLAATLAELQAQLDEFCRIYNYERPHQGIGRVTPISRWNQTDPAVPSGEPIDHPEWPNRFHEVTVNTKGVVQLRRFTIHVGVEWEGQPAKIQIAGLQANVFIDGKLVRHLTLDPNRNYQPSNRPRGGKLRARVPS